MSPPSRRMDAARSRTMLPNLEWKMLPTRLVRKILWLRLSRVRMLINEYQQGHGRFTSGQIEFA